MKKQAIPNGDFKIETEESESLLREGRSFRSEKLTSGAVEFARFLVNLGDAPETSVGFLGLGEPKAKLEWQGFYELHEMYGLATTFNVFGASNLGKPIDELISDVKRETSDRSWTEFEKRLVTLGGEKSEDLRGEAYVLAVWAQLFSEPLSVFWLAAMAQHAFFVEEDHYAFGYFTALLDLKRGREAHFLRGKKILKNAGVGGRARAKAVSMKTALVLEAMGKLEAEGHSVARSAELAFNQGLGTSPGANRKLWQRHKK